MNYFVLVAAALPVIAYTIIGFRRESTATTLSDYFIYSATVNTRDYANVSVGYALQMQAMLLFAYWGALYGWGALWTAVFWLLGFLLLYALLPRFIDYHDSGATTLHEYLARSHGAGRSLQVLAATATIIGLWGAMMAEVDYTTQLFPSAGWFNPSSLSVFFIAFGVTYIIRNGYKAEVITERFQIPAAYAGLIVAMLFLLPSVAAYSGRRPYTIIWCFFSCLLVLMVIAKLMIGLRDALHDWQFYIPIIGLLIALALCPFGPLFHNFLQGSHSFTDSFEAPPGFQIGAQGFIGLLSLFVANALWMPVDLSTWQRIASVKGDDNTESLLSRLKRGNRRVLLESPVSWCLGIVLGFIIKGSGVLSSTQAPDQGVSMLAAHLANNGMRWSYVIYPVLIAAAVSIMLSTVHCVVSAIGFTAFRDVLPPRQESGVKSSIVLKWPRLVTIALVAVGIVVYYFVRRSLGATLTLFLYASYSAQLSLFVIAFLALVKRRLCARAAIGSILAGFGGTIAAFLLARHTPDNPTTQVLPPLFAVGGAFVGYVLLYNSAPKRERSTSAAAGN